MFWIEPRLDRSALVKKILGLAFIVFCITLGIVIGYRMSAEAMAVVIGIVCGVAASIPMSAVILSYVAKNKTSAPELSQKAQSPAYTPPIYIVERDSRSQFRQDRALQPPAIIPSPRQFRIVGQEWKSPAGEENNDENWFAVVR
jgi:hypothetical protein